MIPGFGREKILSWLRYYREARVPGQALEELSHSHEIKLVRAVEHHTLNSHRFA